MLNTNQNVLPDEKLDLFEKRALAYLATMLPDGSPHVTPVWVDYDGKYLLMTSARGRQKDLNMRRDPKVAVTIQDPDNPYRYLAVIGSVDEITTQGADEHIDKMAKKYTGQERYGGRQPGEVRILYKILPEKALN